MLFLQSYGVSTIHAKKIFKTFGANSIAVVNAKRASSVLFIGVDSSVLDCAC